MRFCNLFLLIYLHIDDIILPIESKPILNIPLKLNPGFKLVQHLSSLNLVNLANYADNPVNSNFNNRESLIKVELSFVANLGVRIESLFHSFKKLLQDYDPSDNSSIIVKIDEFADNSANEIKNYVNDLTQDLKNIINGHSSNNNVEKAITHKSFTNVETIKLIFGNVSKVYKIVIETVEKNLSLDKTKDELLWTVTNKTVLFSFSTKVMFIKMIYDYTHLKKIDLNLLKDGIYYLILFESGISEKINNTSLEEKVDYFNNFIERYDSSATELIWRSIWQVKEVEEMLNLTEKTNEDLKLMHKDFIKIVKPLIKLSGAVV